MHPRMATFGRGDGDRIQFDRGIYALARKREEDLQPFSHRWGKGRGTDYCTILGRLPKEIMRLEGY
jgi:hypothetical protein